MFTKQGGMVEGILGLTSGLPVDLPFGLPLLGASNHMMNGRSTYNMSATQNTQNVTAFLSSASNMTTGELLLSLRTALLSAIIRQYLTNDFFAGGLGLMIIGLLGSQVQRIWTWAVQRWFTRDDLVQFHVKHGTEMYVWIQEWLGLFSEVKSNQYEVQTYWEDDDDQSTFESDSGDASRVKIRLFPELKTAQHIKHGKEVIWVQSSSSVERVHGGGEEDRLLPSKLDNLLLSASSKEVLTAFLQVVMEASLKKKEEVRETSIYRWSCNYNAWDHVGTRKVRPLDSVILDCDPRGLLEDVKRFLKGAAWYADRGIPHRRGYLLYGPPGCGKTSLIKVLAGELKLDVSLISLSTKDLTDDILQNAMNDLPHRSVFVIEDVDAAFSSDRKSGGGGDSGDELASARTGHGGSGLSFSGLLNAIDGITAQEGSIVVMTTNHIEKLDPALIRPGRIDFRLYLGLASTTQACGIFRRFFPDATPEQEEQFARAVPNHLLSPASLQGFFLEHRDDVELVLSGIADFVALGGKGGMNASESETPVSNSVDLGEAPKADSVDEGVVVEQQRRGWWMKERQRKKSKENSSSSSILFWRQAAEGDGAG